MEAYCFWGRMQTDSILHLKCLTERGRTASLPYYCFVSQEWTIWATFWEMVTGSSHQTEHRDRDTLPLWHDQLLLGPSWCNSGLCTWTNSINWKHDICIERLEGCSHISTSFGLARLWSAYSTVAYVQEKNNFLDVLVQKHGSHNCLVAFWSSKLPLVMQGMPATVAAMAILIEKSAPLF